MKKRAVKESKKARMKGVLQEVLDEIRPSHKEIKEVKVEAVEIMKKLRRSTGAKIILGGSYAKGTAIKKNGKDVDIFVAFGKSYRDKSLELAEILHKALIKIKIKASRLHGSRDYFQYKKSGIDFEIIPILAVKKAQEALNITDVSPLHVDYVLGKIKKKSRLAEDIMLAKAFAYGCNCYGAESYIGGFSGYVVEILVCHFGSFEKFLKAASEWDLRDKIVIDPAKFYKSRQEVLWQMNVSKLQGPVVLIDPVQKERNAASALTSEKLKEFVKSARRFLKSPSKNSFKKKVIDVKSLERLAKGKAKLFVLKIKTRGKEDITGAKLLRFFNQIRDRLNENGFDFIAKWQFDYFSYRGEF